MKNYNEALARLNNRQSRKLENHTYLQNTGNAIVVKLHETNVVTFQKDGMIILNSGGWLTSTTKDRINKYSPCRITQAKGLWTVNGKYAFADGITFYKGKVTGVGNVKKQNKLQAQAKTYVDKFISKLSAGEIDLPSEADCWYCVMHTADGKSLGEVTKNQDHIPLHVKESYFVPSMLFNAIKLYPVSPIAHDWMQYQVRGLKNECDFFRDGAIRQIKSSLRHYVKQHLAIAA